MPADETPDAMLAAAVRTTVMKLRRRLVNEHDPANDLSIGAMTVLGHLGLHGESTVGELAARERVRPPSMTRTVNCLADGGYVDRAASETDRRQVIVAITDKGRQAIEADRARRTEWLAQRLDELSAQERALLARAATILDRIADQ
jgi:DNA-binding MarR family transcriptional regulator